MMLDYAETVVVTRARSLKMEEALQHENWELARQLADQQVRDSAALYVWISDKCALGRIAPP